MEIYEPKRKEHKRIIDIGGGVTWLVCVLISLAIIHFSCSAGTATGYVGSICTNGLGILDYIGLICCAPVYLFIIILLSGGLRIW